MSRSPIRVLAACILSLLLPTGTSSSLSARRETSSVAAAAALAIRQIRPSIVERLERYEAGEYSAASFAGVANLDATVQALENESRRWIRRDSASERRRRLIVAAFSLEAAESLVGSSRQALARRLIEWGCTQVRVPDPPGGVHQWLLASIALAQRTGDWDLLLRGIGHLGHAGAGLAGHPRLALAEAVAIEVDLWDRRAPGPDPANRGGFAVAIAIGRAEQEALRALQQRYGELAGETAGLKAGGSMEKDVRAEARLRLGVVSFRLGELDAAAAHLARVPAIASEPHVVSLAHMFLGIIDQRAGRPAEAAARYRAALAAAPATQSVSSLLSALLIDRGDLDEARAVVQAAFAVDPPPRDPWHDYRTGDARRWPQYLAELREALR